MHLTSCLLLLKITCGSTREQEKLL